MRNLPIVAFLLLSLTSIPAGAATEPWRLLSPVQQEALAPLSQQWDKLPELQQRRLLNSAKRYPSLTAEQKQRFHARLEAWSKLTPEQRKAAREKYHAFSKLPPETREQVKRMVKQDMAKKTQQPASGVSTVAGENQPGYPH